MSLHSNMHIVCRYVTAYYFFSLCLLSHNVCMLVCVCEFTPLFVFLLSIVYAQWNTYITKAKSWGRLFHTVWLTDYIIWFSLHCVHICAHTDLVADGGRHHTCTHHTLTVSFLLTQTQFEHVQTVHTHAHTLQGHYHPPTSLPLPTVDSKLDPQCPEAKRQKDREKDQWAQWCVCYLHPNPQFFPSLSSSSFSPNSNLQIQQSVSSTCNHANILSIFICSILHLTHRLCIQAHGGHLQNYSYKLVLMSKKLKTIRHTQWSESIAALTFCVLNYTFVRVAGLHRLTLKMSSEKCNQVQGHQDNPKELTHSQMKYCTWWSM